MKRLLFSELLLMSSSERAARRVPFHARSTVIRGNNDTGKSSILKSLYGVLGASVPNVHPRWVGANVVTSLKFSIDGDYFRVIRSGSRFTLFDAEDRALGSYTSVTNELAPQIASMFDFALTLRVRGGTAEEAQATPAFLFLPFYIDQDTGWTKKLESFERLQQFDSPKLDLIRFHYGINPPAYYRAKARLASELSLQQPIRQQRTTLQDVKEDVEQRLGTATFSVNLNEYRDHIARLLERCNALKEQETRMRDRMVSAYRQRAAIDDQLTIAKQTLEELRADRHFAEQLEGDSVHCPMCQAEYHNNFAERFAIAVDEDRVLSLMTALDAQRRSADAEYTIARTATAEATERVSEVERILAERKETVALQDVFRSEGQRELSRVMRDRLEDLDREIGESEARADESRQAMREFENRERREQIEGYYRAEMGRLLQRLAVRNLPEQAYRKPEGVLRETGSDLPRALLAFFFASVRTIARFSSCAFCPLVIDSPRQQDQDAESWSLIRECIRDERPDSSQLILAVADDGESDFGGDVITLTAADHVLNAHEYETAAAELNPLIELGIREAVRAEEEE